MPQRRRIAAGSVLLSGVLAMASGCEDAAKKTVVRAPVPASALKQANPPAAATARAPRPRKNPTPPAAAPPTAHPPPNPPPLPLPKHRILLMLPAPLRGTKEDLV